MYKGKYTPLELSLENIQRIESKTIQRERILNDLWILFTNSKYLSENEKDFIFQNSYKKEQFKDSELDDSYFSFLYLIYANDLLGIGKFYKWLSTPVTQEQMAILEKIKISLETLDVNKQQLIKANILVEIDRQKAIIDIQYLNESAEKWEKYLDDNRGTTNYKLLKEFTSETFTHFKELKKDIRNKALGNNTYLHRKLQLFLFSKYAFITAKKIGETFDNDKHYFALKLGSENLRFNEFSMAHILMRHYAQGVRNYDFIRSKSVHIGDFPFNKIHLKLEEIFLLIENSQTIDNDYFKESVVNLRFKYKGIPYFLGTKIDLNQNEKGNVPFRRVETFHIIEDKNMLTELEDNFKIVDINDYLQFYNKK